MSNELSFEKVKNFFETATKANSDAWAAQTDYLEGMVKRNLECFKDLGEAQISSLKELFEARTFNQGFESGLAFEDTVREHLTSLHEENTRAWDGLMDELKSIYKPAKKASGTKAKKAA